MNLKFDEMLINAIQNPNKKFQHTSWNPDYTMCWDIETNTFQDSTAWDIDIRCYSNNIDGWVEVC